MEEISVRENAQIYDVTLQEASIRKDYNLIVVAIKKNTGEMIFNPYSQTKFHPGDTLVVLGDRENLSLLEKKLGV
jgi:voltage-gated potassium channel